MKRPFATVLALAVLALASGARLFAHEGHEHKVMGTVTMAAADHVMLKDRAERRVGLVLLCAGAITFWGLAYAIAA